MRKWMVTVAAITLVAISGGVALASWGGGTGSDAVSVDGTVEQVDTKYYIDGVLTALCVPATPDECNVLDDEGDGIWLLDFGAGNYYLDNPGDCAEELANFPDNLDYIIDGKLARGGEIDVYRVDGCDLRSGVEGGSPPWAVGDDSDNDGFADAFEAYVGTDALDGCPDDPADDAWPPDIDMSGDISATDDMFNYVGRIGAMPGDSNWWQRLDIDMSGDITATGDMFMYVGIIGATCQ